MSKPELPGKRGTCVVCGAIAEGELCFRHERALRELRDKYPAWRAAFNYTVREYLEAVVKRKETGEWAKELARYILESGRYDMLGQRP